MMDTISTYRQCTFDWHGSGDDFDGRYEAAAFLFQRKVDKHRWSMDFTLSPKPDGTEYGGSNQLYPGNLISSVGWPLPLLLRPNQ